MSGASEVELDEFGEQALTLGAVAKKLGKTPQRISQLLADGQLEGPRYPGRAPNDAGRVWPKSLRAYQARKGLADPDGAELQELKARVEALETLLEEQSVEVAQLRVRCRIAETRLRTLESES